MNNPMDEPPNREAAVLNRALELPPKDRAAFLDRTCADDVELRQRIEALLQAHEQAGGFMETAPAAMSLRPTVRLEPSVTEKPGDRIGRYKLLQQIGEGGCGIVYMAEQEEPVRRRVALKVIKLGMDTKQVIARFEAERQALALMEHPNIAKVLDAGATETGRPYFVMELVRGVKITEFCDEQKVTTEERLKLFTQVCHAIQHAHQKGIIHRDIKPSNILVTINDGVPLPKVIDFGIAKATAGRLTDQTVFTAFEQFIGTPAYMSPEQAVMTSLDIDTRSDIYSLGVLLYELLTGKTPFDQKELLAAGLDEMRRTIREKEPPKPSTRLSTMAADALTTTAQHRHTDAPRLIHVIRGDLDWIVMKCLAKERGRRYETANGLAADVQRHLTHEPVMARPPSKLYEFQKLVRRHKAGFGFAAIFLLLLILGVTGLAISNRRIRNEKELKEEALVAATHNEKQARSQLYNSLKRQAETRHYSRQIGQRIESLDAVTAAAKIQTDAELRDIAIAAMAVPDFRFGPAWQAFGTNDLTMGFSSDYQLYAVADKQGNITIRSVSESRPLQNFHGGAPVIPAMFCRSLQFSPNDQLLAKLDTNYQWSVWRLADQQLLLRAASEGCLAAAFSRDSKHLAVGRTDHIAIFEVETGMESQRWPIPRMPYSLQFSPDSRWLAVGWNNSTFPTNRIAMQIYDVTSKHPEKILPSVSSGMETATWHPSGRYLAVTASEAIQIWDLEATTLISELEGHYPITTIATFSPDGQWLVSNAWDDTPRLWSPSPGHEWARCFSKYSFFRFSPDGRWAGVTWKFNGEASLLEVIPSREYQTFFASRYDAEHSFQCAAISPNGRLLVVGSVYGFSLRELPSGRELACLPVGDIKYVRFTPDGQKLLTSGPKIGLKIWPLSHTNPANIFRINPARTIKLPPAFQPLQISLDKTGTLAAISSEKADESRMVDLVTGELRPIRFPQTNVSYVALSPDANWLATGGWHSRDLRVWNARTGELLWSKLVGRSFPAFTPDGRELIVGDEDGFAFFSTNSWQASRKVIPVTNGNTAWIAHSLDGNMMAVSTGPGIIRLMEASTGRLLATLKDPNGNSPLWMGFCSDDTQLICVVNTERTIHRWDLRAIRTNLKKLDLDWEWPEFPPESKAGSALPIEVEIINDLPH